MDVVYIGLVHCDFYRCKYKDFCTVSFQWEEISKRHLQGLQYVICFSVSK